MLKIISCFQERAPTGVGTQETSSVAGLSSIFMAAIGKVAKLRGTTLPFINYSKVNCTEAALKEQALSKDWSQ